LLSWWRHGRKRAPLPEAEAAALLAAHPFSARPDAAGRHTREGDPDVFAKWDRVMRTVAELTGRVAASGAEGKRPVQPQPEPDLVERLELYLEQQKEARRKESRPPHNPPARRPVRRKAAWFGRRS
jgi:hypothetical protein